MGTAPTAPPHDRTATATPLPWDAPRSPPSSAPHPPPPAGVSRAPSARDPLSAWHTSISPQRPHYPRPYPSLRPPTSQVPSPNSQNQKFEYTIRSFAVPHTLALHPCPLPPSAPCRTGEEGFAYSSKGPTPTSPQGYSSVPSSYPSAVMVTTPPPPRGWRTGKAWLGMGVVLGLIPLLIVWACRPNGVMQLDPAEARMITVQPR
jgi:hypothetical protein